MKRALSIVLAFGVGVTVLAGCDSGNKKDEGFTVKDLRSRGKPVEAEKR